MIALLPHVQWYPWCVLPSWKLPPRASPNTAGCHSEPLRTQPVATPSFCGRHGRRSSHNSVCHIRLRNRGTCIRIRCRVVVVVMVIRLVGRGRKESGGLQTFVVVAAIVFAAIAVAAEGSGTCFFQDASPLVLGVLHLIGDSP